jgi:hypothetical protein
VCVPSILTGAETVYPVGVGAHSLEAVQLGLELFVGTLGQSVDQGPVLFPVQVIFEKFQTVRAKSVQGHPE